MADLSKIRLNGVDYNLKDATARQSINSIAEKFQITGEINLLTLEITLDKTIAEIDSAVRAGKTLSLHVSFMGSSGDSATTAAIVYETSSNYTYGSLNALAIFNNGSYEMWVAAMSGTTDDGTKNTMWIATNPFNVPTSTLELTNDSGYITAASPTLTGTPTAPTATTGTNTTQIATTAFVSTAISNALGDIETLLAAI